MSNETETPREEQEKIEIAEEAPEEQAQQAEQAEPSEPSGQAEQPAQEEEKEINTLPENALLLDFFTQEKPQPEEKEPGKLALWFKKVRDTLVQTKWLHRSLIGLVVAAAVVCFFLFGGQRWVDRGIRLARYTGDNTEFSFDAHTTNNYLSFRRGLAVASVSNLQYLNRNGKETALIQNRADTPALLQNGKVILSYGVGSSTLTAAHHRKGECLNRTVPGTLIDADLSPDSCVCYSDIEPGYKAVLTALNGDGAEIYSFYSSTRFFSQCALSRKAEYMAAIALGQSDSSFESACVIFRTDREEPFAELSLGSDLIYELHFVSARRLCAVGETALHYFDIDGSHYVRYPYEGGELIRYNVNGKNFAAIVCNTNQAGSRYRITTVGENGKTLAELSLDEEILDMSANGNYLAILTSNSLRVYDRRLRICLAEDNVGFATRVCVQEDGAALLIDGSNARRVS